MCKINDEINKKHNMDHNTEILKLLSNQILKLSSDTKDAIKDVKNELSSHIDREIGHLNKNIKSSQEFTNLKFEEIEKAFNRAESDTKKNAEDIESMNHSEKCPNDLDVKLAELEKTLAPIIAIAKYKILQLMLIITVLVLMLSAYNSFSKMSEESKRQLNTIEETIKK